MSDQFTGGDTLTDKDGLKYYIHKTMMLNELSNGIGAYKISNAKEASSGPSFGPIQYDLGSNKDGRSLFENIARTATDVKGVRIISDVELTQIQDHLYKPFNKMSDADKVVYAELKPKMDLVLSSTEGKAQINADYGKVLDSKVVHVNAVIDNISNPENKAFLLRDLTSQVMISDINNQYGSKVNSLLGTFLNQTSQEGGVTPPKGILVKISGTLDSTDISAFRMATEYGINNTTDAKRRDKNIADVVGTRTLSLLTPTTSPTLPVNAISDGFEPRGIVFKQGTNETFTYGVLPDGRTGLKNASGETAFASLNPGIPLRDIQTFVNLRQDLKSAQNPKPDLCNAASLTHQDLSPQQIPVSSPDQPRMVMQR
jgi:hypothetical protein